MQAVNKSDMAPPRECPKASRTFFCQEGCWVMRSSSAANPECTKESPCLVTAQVPGQVPRIVRTGRGMVQQRSVSSVRPQKGLVTPRTFCKKSALSLVP